MKKLIARFKRPNHSLLTLPATSTPGSVASAGANARPSITNVDASVHDHSQGHMFIFSGNNNTINHGSSFAQQSSRSPNDHIRKLNKSYNAEYDMVINATRGPCTPETRTAILHRLENWRRNGKEKIFWLNGMAGTGKTAIAYSASQHWDKSKHLGATFFCSRGVPDCRDIMLILGTIAAELANRFPAFGEALEKALSIDEAIQRRALGVQLRKLVIDPWNESRKGLPEDVVVVIDALDECQNGQDELIKALFINAAKLPFKVLITGRPEPSIRDNMLASAEKTHSMFILHEVEGDMVKADIVKYLRSVLVHEKAETIEAIADLADSLFIYAATLARLVLTRKVNVQRCIQTLQSSVSTTDKSRMMLSLDELYREVLTRVLADSPFEESAQEIKDVLYSVICAREPLTRQALANLWGIGEAEIERRLALLRSVLFISEQDENLPITTFHATFPDFLLDESRSGEFFCRKYVFNSVILGQCITVMSNELHQNMCRLEGRPPNSSVDVGPIGELGQGVRYAATYWVEHFVLSGHAEHQIYSGAITNFLKAHALHWFEYLSFVQRLHVSVRSLESLYDTFGQAGDDSGVLAYEYLRFIQQAYEIVENCAVEVYFSALVWVPRYSLLRTHHASLCENMPRVLSGLPSSWTGPERVINTHPQTINSIAITRNGDRLISGSDDKTVRVWSLRHQIEECIFTGHTHRVLSVAVCEARNRVISGSVDQTVRVWDIARREPVLVIRVSSIVYSVSIPPDGKWIATGQQNDAISLWDATSGQIICSLHADDNGIQSLSFMPNGTNLAVSESYGKIARVCDILTGQTRSFLRGHTDYVRSLACSPVGDMIATGSLDCTARLWDASGKELQVLHGHSKAVSSVAFTLDGKQVITASDDWTLRIWDVSSGEPQHVFKAPGKIAFVAVFEEGAKIATCFGRYVGIWRIKSVDTVGGAEDMARPQFPVAGAAYMVFSSDGRNVLLLPSLRILDTTTLEEKNTQLPHDSNHTTGALSNSGRLVAASTKSPYVISLWSLAEDGAVENYFALQGHAHWINSLSFSRDESRLVSTSSDKSVRIWDVKTGQQIHSLHHSSFVSHAAFSKDGKRIASATGIAAYVWCAQSGQQLRQLATDPSFIAFTPDDLHIITFKRPTSLMTRRNSVTIWNTHTWELHREYEGFYHWTTLEDGSSFAYSDNGWIYHFHSFDSAPRRVLWIPAQYRPTFRPPPFTLSSPELRISLPRRDGLVTLAIPYDSEHYV